MRKLFAKCLIAAVCVVLLAGTVAAQTQTVYNSIPKPLPGNVASEGPEAYGFAELGDGFTLTTTTGTLGQVTVIMSSWACQTGNVTAGCVTANGATFSQPITVNLYSYDGSLATILGTITQTFNIPYRPSSTPSKCNGDAQMWYSSKDKICYHGLAVPITVNFSNQHLAVPANGELIVTVAFNTNTAGPSPIGTPGPYDSLNISTDGNGPSGLSGGVGNLLDTNGIFVNYITSATACPDNTVTGRVALDTPCWTGFHPQIQVQANTNTNGHSKGNGP